MTYMENRPAWMLSLGRYLRSHTEVTKTRESIAKARRYSQMGKQTEWIPGERGEAQASKQADKQAGRHQTPHPAIQHKKKKLVNFTSDDTSTHLLLPDRPVTRLYL